MAIFQLVGSTEAYHHSVLSLSTWRASRRSVIGPRDSPNDVGLPREGKTSRSRICLRRGLDGETK